MEVFLVATRTLPLNSTIRFFFTVFAEDEEVELVYGFDTIGYAQLPGDHLSDSFESSHNSTTPHLYGGMEIQAATHNQDISGQNGGHVTHFDGLQNEAAAGSVVNGSSYQNGPHGAHSEGMENEGSASISNVVHIDGMEIHVYGPLAGLHLSSHSDNNLDTGDDEEIIDVEADVDEIERQRTEDAAFHRAKEADDARRLAPLPPDRCQAIKKAMQSISLGGFQPEWADKVPEEQWINRIRRKSTSKSTETENSH